MHGHDKCHPTMLRGANTNSSTSVSSEILIISVVLKVGIDVFFDADSV